MTKCFINFVQFNGKLCLRTTSTKYKIFSQRLDLDCLQTEKYLELLLMEGTISSPIDDAPKKTLCISSNKDEDGNAETCHSLVNAAKMNHHQCVEKELDAVIVEDSQFSILKHQESLFVAADNESYEAVEIFLDKGFKPNTKAKYKEKARITLLHVASRKLSLKLMKLLLKKGADINAEDDSKQSCLHYIIKHGDYTDKMDGISDKKEKGLECLRLLLRDKNIDIDQVDHKGMTALHNAAIQKNDSYVVELIER
jgi:translation elongation factor P/translation initiation factor 5A